MSLLTLLSRRRYSDRVLATRRANLLGYWPLWETAGTTAFDLSGNGRNGTYTGVDLGQPGFDGRTVPLWDATNDYLNIYSVSLRDAFNPLLGTVAIWFKVASSGVWTDGINRYLLNLRADANNRVSIRKSATNNTLVMEYDAGGTIKSISPSGMTSTDWIFACITWDKAGDAMRAGIGGALSSVQTGLGVWAGTLATTTTLIGANASTPTNVFSGYEAHVPVWNVALTASEVANLARL